MIQFSKDNNTITLHTKASSYQMKIDPYGVLLHTYYGRRISYGDISNLIVYEDRGFAPNPDEADGGLRRNYSLDYVPQEFSSSGVGDFRLPSIILEQENGSMTADFRYVRHEIRDGKYALQGLPAFYETQTQPAQTLTVTLRDSCTQVELDLLYGVFEELDLITRAVIVRNTGNQTITLEQINSLCLDFMDADYDFIHFDGAYGREREINRVPLSPGVQAVGSVRGSSSHQHNPFCVLCGRHTTEDYGECFGMAFVYSGSFQIAVERTQFDQTRLTAGIHPFHFRFHLAPQEVFTAPEAALIYSDTGLTGMSHRFHRAIRGNLCRGPWKTQRRPLLINNWEATEFDFDADKIVSIAKQAALVGVEMMVMDDGWFGHRNNDNGGLGDWYVNEKKLPGGLRPLADRLRDLGMKFGIWVEPESVSEDSDLYQKHPDWAFCIPARKHTRGRSQLVLDLTRPEVREYIYTSLSGLLKSADISYMKWDMNRSLSNIWSYAWKPEQQGEIYHRYILGLYEILEQLHQEFPHVLIEGCSGGGGRFDCGMLYYQPQIWCSDNTDAIERLRIQYGTSFCYPIGAIGAHVSAVPNQQTGRTVSMKTRAAVAMCGTFGYELDLNKLNEEDLRTVGEQNEWYQKYHWLVEEGDYYRLTSPLENEPYTACMFTAPDRTKALVIVVQNVIHVNQGRRILKLKGLNSEEKYCLNGEVYGGSQLMYAGVPLAPMGEYEAVQLYLEQMT